MNDRFKDKVSAPFALSEMPVTIMANAIRALAMDAVQAANSGHPGMPMGMAEIAVALWGRHLSHNPADPHWPNRDRFVLSNGHGSMLQYALLWGRYRWRIVIYLHHRSDEQISLCR